MHARTSALAKIVAHTKDGRLFKGYPDASSGLDAEALSKNQPISFPEDFTITLEDSSETMELRRDSLKAIFFVRSFEGSKEYNEIKFFESHPPVEGLWVRLRYHDNECTEGVVYNSLQLLLEPGFCLKPPDPNSNNQVVYVLKDSLKEFRVLGVKGIY